MYKNFSNEPTAKVFDLLVSRNHLYQRAVEKAVNDPANAPDEIRTWVRRLAQKAVPEGNPFKDFVDASLRGVRWMEIRAELQRQSDS